MTDPRPLIVSRAGAVARVALNRPDVRNAFDDALVAEATESFRALGADPTVRAIVLSGEGKTFCAGGDLAWMSRMVTYGREENERDADALAGLFATIDGCPKPVVARVQGAALGGGAGLAAVCDVVVAAERALFGTTEVRLGIAPAVISPYVVRKIGESRARHWFLTGERFDAHEARAAGLVHRVVPEAELDREVSAVTSALLEGGPEALAASKRLAREVGRLDPETARAVTVRVIAERRASVEGQEGMRAFLEKRKPAWGGAAR